VLFPLSVGLCRGGGRARGGVGDGEGLGGGGGGRGRRRAAALEGEPPAAWTLRGAHEAALTIYQRRRGRRGELGWWCFGGIV
jgi:hypothetical protein